MRRSQIWPQLRRWPARLWRAFRHWLNPGVAESAWTPAVPTVEPPAALLERLRALPRQIVLCRDIDRRWSELLAAEQGSGSREPGHEGELSSDLALLRQHVDSCERCDAVVGALRVAVTLPRLELPARLVFRLPAVARQQPKLPRSLREPRWALAASLLMALALQLLIGDLQAFAEGSRVQLETVRGAVTETRGRAESWWSGVVGEVEPVLASGREELDDYGRYLRREADALSASVEALRCRAAAEGWTDSRTWFDARSWRADLWRPASEASHGEQMTTDSADNDN